MVHLECESKTIQRIHKIAKLFGSKSSLLGTSVRHPKEEAHQFLSEGKPGLRMLVNNAGYKDYLDAKKRCVFAWADKRETRGYERCSVFEVLFSGCVCVCV